MGLFSCSKAHEEHS